MWTTHEEAEKLKERLMDEAGRRSVLRMARATAEDCEPARKAVLFCHKSIA